MTFSKTNLRRLIMETLREGDVLSFSRPTEDQDQSEPDGEEAEILSFPQMKPDDPVDKFNRELEAIKGRAEERQRKYEEERDRPGVPAEIPATKIESDRQARVEYAAYVIGRVARLATSLDQTYKKDVMLMHKDPMWKPYAPKPEMPIKRGKPEKFNHAVLSAFLPGVFGGLTTTTAAEVDVYTQIRSLMPIMDRSDPEEAGLYDNLVSAQNFLDLFKDLVESRIPTLKGLNESGLRAMIRSILEGDVINVGAERFKRSSSPQSGAKADVVQLPGTSKEEMFDRNRPRHMALYDIAKDILSDPETQKLLKVRAAFENNMYTKSKSARVYIDNKTYEISGERMKELGVNPYAKPLD
jgi:hypothetical protein